MEPSQKTDFKFALIGIPQTGNKLKLDFYSSDN